MPIREPAVSRTTLLATAAIVWLAAAIFLIVRAALLLPEAVGSGLTLTLLVGTAGIWLGLAKGRWVLARIAKANVLRIMQLSPHKEAICIFAFQAWQSYLVVLVMIGLGALLRISPLARVYILGVYLLIGIALAIGSLPYFRTLLLRRRA